MPVLPAYLTTHLATELKALSAVEAALKYAAYAADWRLAVSGADMWSSKFGTAAKGDAILGKKETETRPDACMRILAAEVGRLRALTQPKSQIPKP